MKTWERNLTVMSSTLRMNERMLVLALASYLPPDKDDAMVWPSAAALAERAGCHERTVRSLIKRGAEAGWLSVEAQQGSTFHIRIVWAALDTPEESPGGSEESPGVDPGRIARGGRKDLPGGSEESPDEVVHEEVHEEVQSLCQPGKPADEGAQVILLSEHQPAPKPKPEQQLLEICNRVRAEQRGKPSSWGMTDARRSALRGAWKRLKAEGLTLEDFERAAVWVYLSTAPQAEGARKTGEPLVTLLRPHATVRYCHAAAAGVGMAPGAPGSPAAGVSTAGSPFTAMLRWVASEGRRGCPSTAEQAAALMGDDWPRHQAALRALGTPGHPKATVQGWVAIAEADHDAARARLQRIYDNAYRGARSTA